MTCKICGSHAINQHSYDREIGVDTDLCDVHYWMKRALPIRVEVSDITAKMVSLYFEWRDERKDEEIIAAAVNAWLKCRK